MADINDLRLELAALQKELEIKRQEAENWEVEVDDEAYDALLDDIYPEIVIGRYFSCPASRALKELDPIGYRCGKCDYADTMDKRDDPKYQELQDEISDLEVDIGDLEGQIAELKQEDIDE